MNVGPVDLAQLLSGMSGLLAQSVGPSVRVDVYVDEDARFVISDGNQLELALLNLAVNARDAMPEGGTLTIKARHAALAQEAQLKMLRYQLNPHFLFNTLNAISTLILDNRNSVANSAVTGLSEFLRYTLDQDPMKKVTVAQEIDALNLYLDIEKLRFGPRLTIEFAIDANASTMLMPSLLLQPLIENAIKYAVSPREQGGKIRIGGHVTGGMLQLEVSDDGPGLVDCSRLTNGRGVGIRNTRERLQVLYGERGVVDVRNTEPGLRCALTFPAEAARAAA